MRGNLGRLENTTATEIVEDGVNESTQVRDVRHRGMGPAGAVRGIEREVALIPLIAEPPELARRIPVVEEELGHLLAGF
jgi:hypothetical protein